MALLVLFIIQVPRSSGTRSEAPIPLDSDPQIQTLEKQKAEYASHQVALIYAGYASAYEGYFCSGSLIAPSWVLTAAHCLSKRFTPSDIAVAASSPKLSRATIFPVTRILRHEAFDRNRMVNDIALLKLSTPVLDMQPIRLADFSVEDHFLKLHRDAIASGWGGRSFHSKQLSDDLLQVSVPLVPRDVCNHHFGGAVTKQMVCAGGGDRDTCEGDSGGGLVISDEKISYLEGIVSWGKGCGGQDGLGVYTRVPSYIKWVRTHIRW